MDMQKEVLIKSFGDGVMVLRFHEAQTPSSVFNFISEIGFDVEQFILGTPNDVYLLMAEGNPVTLLEVRNTDDEWESLLQAVSLLGNSAFKTRIETLKSHRESLSRNDNG